MLNKGKSQEILRKVEKYASAEWQAKFYEDLRRLKLKCSGYYNISKLRDMLFGSTDFDIDERSLRLRRIMSKYFLDSKLIPSLITSKKLSAELILEHLKCRREVEQITREHEINAFVKADET